MSEAELKLIIMNKVQEQDVHDSQKFTDFLDDTDVTVYADSAYVGKEVP